MGQKNYQKSKILPIFLGGPTGYVASRPTAGNPGQAAAAKGRRSGRCGYRFDVMRSRRQALRDLAEYLESVCHALGDKGVELLAQRWQHELRTTDSKMLWDSSMLRLACAWSETYLDLNIFPKVFLSFSEGQI